MNYEHGYCYECTIFDFLRTCRNTSLSLENEEKKKKKKKHLSNAIKIKIRKRNHIKRIG